MPDLVHFIEAGTEEGVADQVSLSWRVLLARAGMVQLLLPSCNAVFPRNNNLPICQTKSLGQQHCHQEHECSCDSG
jgi:hypothetical protein